ncbi:hypothetical protein ACCS56_37645, partial [Rhizobium ruizarguesonis]
VSKTASFLFQPCGSALSPAERKIALVFQSYALYPHMSVRKNLAFGLENLKFKRAEIEARIAEAARMLAIEPYLDLFDSPRN